MAELRALARAGGSISANPHPSGTVPGAEPGAQRLSIGTSSTTATSSRDRGARRARDAERRGTCEEDRDGYETAGTADKEAGRGAGVVESCA